MKTSWTGSLSEHNLESKIKNLKFGLVAGAMLFALYSPAWAQQPKKVPRIGFLAAPSPSFFSARAEGFRQGLRDLGYIEGKNIVIEYRYAEGKRDRLPELAAELVSLKVDVIVASGAGGLAAKNTTQHPNCLRFSSRSGCDQTRGQSSEAGRERHRTEQSRPGVKRKETRANKRGSSKDHTGSFSLEFRPRQSRD